MKRINTNDKNLELIQQNVADAVAPLENSPFIGGTLLGPLSLHSASNNTFQHGLSYQPTYAWASLPNVDTRVWLQQATRENVILKCSADCTVYVWVK